MRKLTEKLRRAGQCRARHTLPGGAHTGRCREIAGHGDFHVCQVCGHRWGL